MSADRLLIASSWQFTQRMAQYTLMLTVCVLICFASAEQSENCQDNSDDTCTPAGTPAKSLIQSTRRSTLVQVVAKENETAGGNCEWWCESDIKTNGKERHCKTDMVKFCGDCSYCGSLPPPPKREEGAIGIVSYNLMSWCTQGICKGKRLRNMAAAIASHSPAVLGTQEHGDHNAPYESVRDGLEGAGKTSLTHRGAGTYYNPELVEPVGDIEEVDVRGSHRKCSGQVYKIKGCGVGACEFAFFNTHWDHSGHWEQATNVISFIKRKADGRPVVLTGDFNVWGSKWSIDKMKNELGMEQVSPEGQTWCTGGTVDFILATKGRFSVSGQLIEGEKCNTDCSRWRCDDYRGDHKLVLAGLKMV